MPCPYEQMGCKTKVQRRQVESHLQFSTRLHLDLAYLKLNNTELRLSNTEVELSRMQETNKKLMEKVDKVEKKICEDAGKTESPDFPVVFVCKINNFSEVLRQAKAGENIAVAYGPFLTGTYGYKLKVKIYPNGCGSSRNTHLSVFIVVMKGEYDAILPWPFEKKVKFTLIDQHEDSVERVNVSHWFRSSNALKHFARPVSEESTGRDFSTFIFHEKLFSRCFVVDDTLFLQAEVGSPSS